MEFHKPELILFDLDGTLVDSVPDLALAIDLMMDDLNLPRRGTEAVLNWVGNGIETLVHRAITNDLNACADDVIFTRAMPIFSDHYARVNGIRSHLFDGVNEGLVYLQGQAYRLGCVTNKARAFTLPLLDTLGISKWFEVIVCGDDLIVKKPDPLPLLTAAKSVGADPTRSLMIGDSVSDVRAARAAGFQIICMSYGYNHGEDIRSLNPDAVINSMAELKQFI
ncbi:MAG: phosphoglycolate phosphatase [Gammaproteobacteria bacterium]|jgi:phosphoglycolate phosphatase